MVWTMRIYHGFSQVWTCYGWKFIRRSGVYKGAVILWDRDEYGISIL